MSNDLEDRLREALRAVPDAPAAPDAYTRNLQRLRDRQRRSTRAAIAVAAAAAFVGVLAVPALDLGRGDTLRPASPGAGGVRPAGEVVETLTAFGRDFDLIEQDGRSGYQVCTSDPPQTCAGKPVREDAPYNGIAVPVGTGAVLLIGSRDNPEVIAHDLIVTGRPGAQPFQPPVEFIESEVLGHRLAALEVPTFEQAYCVASHRDGDGKSYAGITAVLGADHVC